MPQTAIIGGSPILIYKRRCHVCSQVAFVTVGVGLLAVVFALDGGGARFRLQVAGATAFAPLLCMDVTWCRMGIHAIITPSMQQTRLMICIECTDCTNLAALPRPRKHQVGMGMLH
jgi:hypothetical protein